jgi:hypothetical protein
MCTHVIQREHVPGSYAQREYFLSRESAFDAGNDVYTVVVYLYVCFIVILHDDSRVSICMFHSHTACEWKRPVKTCNICA